MRKKIAEFYNRTFAESESLKNFFGADSDWFDWKDVKKHKVIESWRSKNVFTEPKKCHVCCKPYSQERTPNGKLIEKYLPHFFFRLPMQSGRCKNCELL